MFGTLQSRFLPSLVISAAAAAADVDFPQPPPLPDLVQRALVPLSLLPPSVRQPLNRPTSRVICSPLIDDD